MNVIKKAVAAAALTATMWANAEWINKPNEQVLEAQNKYKAEIAKNLWIDANKLQSKAKLDKLWLSIQYAGNTDLKDWTLVAGPAMLKETFKVKNWESWHFEFETQADVDLFNEYDTKLKWMPYFANELVKGKAEYVKAVFESEKFTTWKYKSKPESYKLKKANWYWNSIISQFLEWKDSTWYKKLISRSPEFVKYLVDNYEELSKNETISKPLDYIKTEFNIDKNNKIADKNNKIANDLNSLIWK